MSTFHFAVNTQVCNKDTRWNALNGNFHDKEGTLQDALDHVKQGAAVCAGLLGNQWRSKSNVIGSEWVLLDIDNSTIRTNKDGNPLDSNGKPIKIGNQWVDVDGNLVAKSDGRKVDKIYCHQMTLEEAVVHPFNTQYCAAIYTSYSHRSDWHRFRLIYRLPFRITSIEAYEAIVNYLLKVFPGDPSCKDASRVFYGATSAEFPLVNDTARLPVDIVRQAVEKAEQAKREQAERLKQVQSEREAFQQMAAEEGWDTRELVIQALSCIPPRSLGSGNYDECLPVLMALVDFFGPEEAERIAEQWSPSIHGSKNGKSWNIHRKIKSFKRSGVTIGSLFWIASKHGFRFPERKDIAAEFRYQPEYNRYVAAQEEQEHCEEAESNERMFNRLCSKFIRKRTGTRTQCKGFDNQAQAQKTDPTVDLFFEAGQDLQVYREAMNRGFKYVQNNGRTGTSKTHTAGNARTEDFPWEEIGIDPETGEQFRRRITADRLIFVTNDAQNPTTETLKSWEVFTPRHNGRYIDSKGKKRRVTNSDQKIVERANCVKVDEILALVSKNVPNAQTDLVCQSCPMLEVCVSTPGWQKHDRRESFEADQNLSHILSLPGLENFDYSSTIIFWDEPDSTFVSRKTIKVSASDIDQTIAALAVQNPELFEKLRDALVSLKNLLTIEAPRYGFDYHAVKANLPEAIELSSDEWTELIQALAPDFTGLENPDRLERSSFYEQHSGEIQNIKTKYEKELADLKRRKEAEIANADLLGADALQLKLDANNSPQTRKDRIAAIKTKYKEKTAVLRNQRELKIKQVKSELAKQARQTERALVRATAQPTSDRVEIIERNILKQWLPELLAVLQGAEKGDLRVNFSQLIINIRDDRFANIAKAAKLNVFLDATISREDLADKLGVDPSEIFVVKQKDKPIPNLKISQIHDLGRMGMNRGKEQERRVAAIVNHLQQVDPDMKVIDFKKFATDELTGAWWRDSRGVNDYLTTKTLVLVGTPCQNLADLIAEYACNVGGHPEQDDPGFKAFVDRKIRAEFIQGIGRPRAHRRPNEEIHVVIISDFDLQMDNVEQVKAVDITIDAATKTEQAWMAIREIINRWWTQNGELPTQNQISEATGFKQSHISKLVDKFAGGWKTLKRLVMGLTCPALNPFDGDPSEEESWIVEQQLPVILEQPSEKVASELNWIIEAFGWRGWRRILSLTKQTLRLELLAALFRDGFAQTDQPPVLTG